MVYRFHDGWDQFPEYGMGYALADALGWSNRQVEDNYIYELASVPLEDLAINIAKKLGKQGIRFVGNPRATNKKDNTRLGQPGSH